MLSPRLKRLLANLFLLATGTVVALGLSELWVRRFAPPQRPLTIMLRGLHRPDAQLGYVMVPSFRRTVHAAEFTCDVRTNALGMRDRELTARAPGRQRILAIGDSFTFGIHAGPLDSCFVKRLESALDRELREHPVHGTGGDCRGVEILNAGVDGYGTEQEVGLLQRLASAVHPDAVLLTFYLGNDFTDNSGRTRMTVVDGYQMLEASAVPYRRQARPLQRQVRLWLHANSELYALVKERLRRTAVARSHGTAGDAGAKAFDYYVYDSGFADCLRATPSPQFASALAATRAAFRTLRDWCDAHGARALVVAIPAEQQVSDAARQRWLQRFGLDAKQFDFTLPNRRLAALAAEAGLPLFDLTPGFAARIAAGADLHLHRDNHWNPAGHALAARLLAQPVLESLVEAPPPQIGGH